MEKGPSYCLIVHLFLQIKVVAKSREGGISLSALLAHLLQFSSLINNGRV